MPAIALVGGFNLCSQIRESSIIMNTDRSSELRRTVKSKQILAMFLMLFILIHGNSAKSQFLLRGDSNTSYSISRNGKFMVYTTSNDALHKVYQLDFLNKSAKLLFTTKQYICSLTLIEDDSLILFSSCKNENEPNHIFCFNMKTHKISQITHGNYCDLYPTYDAQNHDVVFIRSDKTEILPEGGKIWYDFFIENIDLNGKNRSVITKKTIKYISEPVSIPNSDSILICPGSMHTSIAVIHDHMSTYKTLLTQGDPWDPIPSPDGKSVYFISDKTHAFDYEIWTMHLDGSDEYQLTHLHSYLQDLQVSPNGKYLYFRSDKARLQTYYLMKMNLSTGKISEICKPYIFTGKKIH